MRECRCSDGAVMRYRARLSGPLLDRIDLHVAVPSVDFAELRRMPAGESSAVVRERVLAAIEHRCRVGELGVSEDAHVQLEAAAARFVMSARAMERSLAVARTIAHLKLADRVTAEHAAQAVQFRGGVAADAVAAAAPSRGGEARGEGRDGDAL